jgi:hypothetical protein
MNPNYEKILRSNVENSKMDISSNLYSNNGYKLSGIIKVDNPQETKLLGHSIHFRETDSGLNLFINDLLTIGEMKKRERVYSFKSYQFEEDKYIGVKRF